MEAVCDLKSGVYMLRRNACRPIKRRLIGWRLITTWWVMRL